MRLALPLTAALLLAGLTPATAAARPFGTQPDDRPWGRGTLMPSLGLGGSFNRGGGGSLLIGAGVTYFAVHNLGLGLNLRNVTTFLPSSLTTDFPGINKQIPTNEFSLTPNLMLVLYRSYRFSPYLFGGAGPVFFNHHRGVVGEWVAGPGVLVGLGRNLAINLGVTFSSRFPKEKCEAAYRYQGQDVYVNPCGFRWGITVGLVFGFGVGRQRPDPAAEQPPSYQPAPAPTSYPEPQPPPPAYTPADEPPPTDAPTDAPTQPDAAPTPAPEPSPAYAPVEPPPATTTPPPGEAMPVTPPPA